MGDLSQSCLVPPAVKIIHEEEVRKMVVLAELVDHVIGVDPDRDRVTAAVVSVGTQGELASKTFPATRRGYGQALRWAKTFTADGRRAWAIESTGSYGAGMAATLAEKGEFVIEFDHPATRASKDGAKSDSLDAVRAARETLGRKTWATPRSRGLREGLRTLIVARDSAKLARVAAINILKALVVTAPVDLREELRGRTLGQLVDRCMHLRPDNAVDPEHAATKLSMTNHTGHAGFAGGSVLPERAGIDPTAILRDFDRGRTSTLPDGRTLREWDIVAVDKDFEIAPGIIFKGWSLQRPHPRPDAVGEGG